MSTSLQILTDIARLLNSRADIEAALDEVLRLVTQLLGLRTAWLFLAEPPGRRLSLASAYQLPPALQANGREPLRWRWCRCFELFYRGDLREAVNVLECSRLEQVEGQRCGLVYHASVPLRSSAGVLGVLNVAAEGSTLFDGGALTLLTAVGEHLGTALERSRLFAHERSRAAAYEAVDRVSRALAGPEPDSGDASLEAIGRRFAAACLEAFSLDAVSVAAGDAAGGLRLAAVVTRPPAVPDASWSAGRLVPERTLLWLSWRFGRAHFGYVRVNGRRGLRSGSGALPQAGSRATLPVTFGGRTLAAVLLEREAPRAWPPAEEDALSSLADHLALALENARIVSRTRELARLEERQRLSRDLHDAVSQNLFSLSMLLAAGREHLHAGQHAVAGDALEEAERRSRTALQEMRRLVQELRLAPAGPRYAGELKAALAGMVQSHPLAGRVGTEVRFVTGPLDESALMGEAAFEALLRVTQEAVHNALKHGAPRLVRVRLAASGGGLALSVRDDGAGFDVRKARTSGGQGLSIMGERCRLAGGRLRVRSRPGAGTLVSAWVPAGGPGGDGAVFAASGAVV